MTSEETTAFGRIAALIEEASTVAICGHTDPDGDALGSVLALTHIIEGRWPGVAVQPLLANDRPVEDTYGFLPGVERFVPAARYGGTPDLFISVDTPMPARLADGAAVLERARTSAAFDHHPTMEPFAQVNVLRAEAAAAGDIVYDFMLHVGVNPTAEVATCILAAILTDTGRFQYQNTDAHALRTAAAMVEAGASPALIATSVYQSYSLPALKLKETVLARLAFEPLGRVAYSYVTRDDLARVGATDADCDSLIDDVRLLEGANACLFMRETCGGAVRGNVRAKVDWLDVSAVARTFGGGGHRAAAGFTSELPMQQALEAAVAALTSAVLDQASSSLEQALAQALGTEL